MTKTDLFKILSLEEWQLLYSKSEFLNALLDDPFNSELAEAVAQRILNAVAEQPTQNMNAINLNNADYYITGTTVWDDGRQREFDDYRRDPIVCPHVHQYGPEALVDDLPNGRGVPPGGSIGFTDTFLTCVKLTAAEHEIENLRREEHFARMLEERDRRRQTRHQQHMAHSPPRAPVLYPVQSIARSALQPR